jgi:hypothetical protein
LYLVFFLYLNSIDYTNSKTTLIYKVFLTSGASGGVGPLVNIFIYYKCFFFKEFKLNGSELLFFLRMKVLIDTKVNF